MRTRPPRLATVLLHWCSPRSDAGFILADAAEEFDEIAHAAGRRAASRWYWQQAVTSVFALLRWRVQARAGRLDRSTSVHLWRWPRGRAIRDSVRMLVRAPGLSLAIVLTLALGISANTAIFSVVDRVLFRPLSYPRSQELVSVWESTRDSPRLTIAPGNFADYAARVSAFTALGGYSRTAIVARRRDAAPEEWAVDRVTSNLLAILGTAPVIGRGFAAADAEPSASPTVILTDAAWRGRFAADPSVVGQTVSLNRTEYTIIGVLPQDFVSPSDIGTSAPAMALIVGPTPSTVDSRQDHEMRAIGRLRSTLTAELAQRQLDAVSADLARQYPETNAATQAHTTSLARDVVRSVRASLLVMLGGVALVVLIACVNVTNLLLAWGLGHQRDVAIRLAIGASRAHIVSEFLMRGVLLGVLGGMVGLMLGLWIRDILVNAALQSLPHLGAFTLNGRVLAVTAVLSVSAGILAGLVPAAQVFRRRLTPTLRASDPTVSSNRRAVRWRGVLVATETAAALMLACGAALLMRSLVLLNRVDLGFDTNRVLTMTIQLPKSRYPNADASLRFFETLATQVRTLPAIESVAYANQFPMRGGWGGNVVVDGPNGPIKGTTDLQVVSADYFLTLGIRLERGRLLTDRDRIGAERVAVVSRTFVNRFAPDREPIGVIIRRTPDAPAITVVGVVGEVRRDGKFDPPAPQVYVPSGQIAWHPANLAAFAVRSSADPLALVEPLRQTVAVIDPELAITNVRSLEEILDASLASRRFNAWLFSAFAGLALILSLIGVYGIVGHSVRQRSREMAIRLALGASRRRVVGHVLVGGLIWAAAGLAIGLLLVTASSRVLTSLLFETAPNELSTLIEVTVALLAVTGVAAYVPARRAAHANPVAILRGD